MKTTSFAVGAAFAAAVLMSASGAQAQKKYDLGASDTEIKLGQTVPHSGPGSLYGVLGRVAVAYFEMINEKGDHRRLDPHRGGRGCSGPRGDCEQGISRIQRCGVCAATKRKTGA